LKVCREFDDVTSAGKLFQWVRAARKYRPNARVDEDENNHWFFYLFNVKIVPKYKLSSVRQKLIDYLVIFLT